MPADRGFIAETINEAKNQVIQYPEPLAIEDLLAMKFPKQEWIFDKIIPVGGLVALSGPPGSYKSYFAVQMALQAMVGDSLFDVPCGLGENKQKFKTLFIEEENSLRLMYYRVNTLKNRNDKGIYFKIDHGFKMADDGARKNIEQFCLFNDIKLLVLDPFSSVMGLRDENNNAEVSLVMDMIRKTFIAQNITVMFLHHPAKNAEGGKNLRGAGDILGKCDVHLSLEKSEKDKQEITVSYEKMRLISESDIWNFKMRFVGDPLIGDCQLKYVDEAKPKFEEERELLLESILEFIQPGGEYTKKEIAESVGSTDTGKKFLNVWAKALKEGWVKQNIVNKKYYR
jgi:hypothetical protein